MLHNKCLYIQKRMMLEEIQKRQEMLKTEMKLRKASRFDEDENDTRRDSLKSIESCEEYACEHKFADVIEFSNNGLRQIQRGSCLSHFENNCTVYSGIDKESGELLAVIEWIINAKNENDFSNVRKQVLNLEQEFNYLVKLRHKNLLHYLNLRNEFLNSDKKIVVQILQEFQLGNYCSMYFLCLLQ